MSALNKEIASETKNLALVIRLATATFALEMASALMKAGIGM